MSIRTENSKLRRELEALRSQAQAYGGLKEVKSTKGKAVKRIDVAETRSIDDYSYVKKDLLRSLYFLVFAICFILVFSLFVSNFPVFQTIRGHLSIHQLII